MSVRRPSAADREIADHIRNLSIGHYQIDVYAYPRVELGEQQGRYLGLAEIKCEGQLTLNRYGPKRIDIYPVKES